MYIQMFIAALFTIVKRWKQPLKSINREMDKETVIQPYSGILFSHREVLIDGYILQTSCPMKEARHKRPFLISFRLYEMSRMGKSAEAESRLVVYKVWE